MSVATRITTGQRTKKENGFERDLESPPQLFLDLGVGYA